MVVRGSYRTSRLQGGRCLWTVVREVPPGDLPLLHAAWAGNFGVVDANCGGVPTRVWRWA